MTDIDPFDKMERDLRRAGGDTWRQYRREDTDDGHDL